MNIKIVIGKVITEGYNWPVYLRELDSDAGPLVQIGDSDAEADCFNSLEGFMAAWGSSFTAFGAMTPEAPSLEARMEKATEALEAAQSAQDIYEDALLDLEKALARAFNDPSVEIDGDDIRNGVSLEDLIDEKGLVEVKK